MIDDKVLAVITDIISSKKEARIYPFFALLSEVLCAVNGITREDALKSLNRLYKGNKILTGHTLNDMWIKINENESR